MKTGVPYFGVVHENGRSLLWSCALKRASYFKRSSPIGTRAKGMLIVEQEQRVQTLTKVQLLVTCFRNHCFSQG